MNDDGDDDDDALAADDDGNNDEEEEDDDWWGGRWVECRADGDDYADDDFFKACLSISLSLSPSIHLTRRTRNP